MAAPLKKPLKVRFQWSGGMKVASIPADATFSTVQTMAQEASGVDKSTMKLLAGFPPQALSLEPDSAITGVVQTGDTIVIEGSAPVVEMTPAEAAEIISSSPAQPKRKRQRKQGVRTIAVLYTQIKESHPSHNLGGIRGTHRMCLQSVLSPQHTFHLSPPLCSQCGSAGALQI